MAGINRIQDGITAAQGKKGVVSSQPEGGTAGNQTMEEDIQAVGESSGHQVNDVSCSTAAQEESGSVSPLSKAGPDTSIPGPRPERVFALETQNLGNNQFSALSVPSDDEGADKGEDSESLETKTQMIKDIKRKKKKIPMLLGSRQSE